MSILPAAIITIGDELLIGQTIDTNSAFIGQELNRIGIWLKRRIAVGDNREDILEALETQSRDCRLVIITGGLGPTADDITKPVLCEYFGGGMVVNAEALLNVKNIFARLNRPLIERNLKQAEVPERCTVLPNLRGTAPGLWFEKEDVVYVSLPGVPHEMKGLMETAVIPRLQETFSLPAVVHRTLLTAGQGESTIADALLPFEAALPDHIKLAYLPSYGLVRLRLTGRGAREAELQKEVDRQFEALKMLVGDWMVADEDIPLQEALKRLLEAKGLTMSTAESCTGGYIAHLITSLPGSSRVYHGSVVAYANEVKGAMLGVKGATLEQWGAVSEQTVTEMVQGVRKRTGTDYALATSGIMGPDGGSADKPVGTVWIAVGNGRQTKAIKQQFRFDRQRNIELTAYAALNLLRRFILDEEKA